MFKNGIFGLSSCVNCLCGVNWLWLWKCCLWFFDIVGVLLFSFESLLMSCNILVWFVWKVLDDGLIFEVKIVM